MHRNTFINAPTLLNATMQFRTRPDLYFGGQITGVEGYVGNIATGLIAAINLAHNLRGEPEFILPQTTMLGSLCYYVSHADPKHFQPMKANFGLLPELPTRFRSKVERYTAYADRALADMKTTLENANIRVQETL